MRKMQIEGNNIFRERRKKARRRKVLLVLSCLFVAFLLFLIPARACPEPLAKVSSRRLNLERRPILELSSLIGTYDPTTVRELIALRRRRRLPPSITAAVFPGEIFPGQLPSKASLLGTLAEVLEIWNKPARGVTRFISNGVADPFHFDSIPGQCNQGWSGPASQAGQIAVPSIVAEKSFFVHQDPNCRYGGEAALGGSSLFITAFTPYVGAHELGHAIGLNHDRLANFTGQVGNFEQATIHEYGDPDSVMAGGEYVTARARLATGLPITVQQSGRSAGRWTLPEMDDNPTAVVLSRDDGLTYILERHNNRVGIRSSYYGSTWCGKLEAPGDTYYDVPGGVSLQYFGNGDVAFTPFAPPPPPTPDPNVTPTAVPTWNPGGTPVPTSCFVAGIIRCTPTPAATETPTVTPSATATATSTPTDTPTPELTGTEVPAETPTATPGPTRTRTAVPVSPSPSPGIPRPRSGCLGFSFSSITLIGAGHLWWRRKRKELPDAR